MKACLGSDVCLLLYDRIDSSNPDDNSRMNQLVGYEGIIEVENIEEERSDNPQLR